MILLKLPATGSHDCSSTDTSWTLCGRDTRGLTTVTIQVDVYNVTTVDNGIVIKAYGSLTEAGLDASNITPFKTFTVAGGTGTPAQQIYTHTITNNPFKYLRIVVDTTGATGSPASSLIITVEGH